MAGNFARDHEIHRRRRGRNVGVLVVLVAFAALLFAVTLVKMGDQQDSTVGNPSAGQGGAWIDGFIDLVSPAEEENAQ